METEQHSPQSKQPTYEIQTLTSAKFVCPLPNSSFHAPPTPSCPSTSTVQLNHLSLFVTANPPSPEKFTLGTASVVPAT